MLTVGHASVRVRSIQPVRLAVSGTAAICEPFKSMPMDSGVLIASSRSSRRTEPIPYGPSSPLWNRRGTKAK